MQHQPHSTPDIELLVARRARQAAEQRLLAEVDAGYGRRSLVAAVRHYAVVAVVAVVLAAGVIACTSVPDGRDMTSADRAAVLSDVNYVIKNL